MKVAQFLAVLPALWAFPAMAQEGGLEILDGETMYEEGALLTLSGIYQVESHLYEGARRISDPLREVQWEYRQTVAVNYGILPELTLAGVVPYVWQGLRFDGPSGRQELQGNGFGDSTLLAKYRVAKEDFYLGSINWTVIAGGQVPTGRTGVRDQGVLLSPLLEPGSGAWDAIVATAGTVDYRRLKLNGYVLYQHNSQGAQDYRFGDLLAAELMAGYRFLIEKYPGPLARADLGLEWRHDFPDRQDSARVPNTGGDAVFLKPRLLFQPTPEWGITAYAEIPLYQDLRGQQLGFDFRVFLGVDRRF